MSLVGFRAQNHPQQRATDDVDDRGTPPEIFGPLDARWHFTVDVAAAEHNAKCGRYYTRDDDGLTRSWADETVWCNPPYSDIEPWVEKAWLEYTAARGIVMLLAANRTEQAWWQRLVEPYRDRVSSPLTTQFLPGRIRFSKGGKKVGPNERPPFGCVVITWASPIHYELHTQPLIFGVLR